jgi:5'-nucleotidase
MRILITNDDGIYSPGIALLAEVAAGFGDVRVVAPDVERSAAAHSITASRPLSYKRTPIKNIEAYRVDGTPADCVALGSHHWEKVDVVLSGINLGSNLGNAMWHSGTLAAAKQAVLLGMRGIALSLVITENEPDFEALAPSLQRVLKLLLEDPRLSLVNVNFPDRTPKGLSWTRQSVRYYDGKIVAGEDPQGRRLFWFTVAPLQGAEIGTDRWAIENGYVSMTPLRLDLTNEEELTAVKARHPLDDGQKSNNPETP